MDHISVSQLEQISTADQMTILQSPGAEHCHVLRNWSRRNAVVISGGNGAETRRTKRRYLGLSDTVSLAAANSARHLARASQPAHLFSVAPTLAPGTCCFRDSMNAVILASSSGFSDLPKAGMLTPPFTIRMTMSSWVRRSPKLDHQANQTRSRCLRSTLILCGDFVEQRL